MRLTEVSVSEFSRFREMVYAVRYDVFVHEQKVPEEEEVDGLDEEARHILVFDGDTPVGTGRMLSDGHIGRIAVLKAYRGQGIGTTVMQRFIAMARESGLQSVWLSSQCHAVEFYNKLGFIEYGEIYLDAGIDHIDMKLVF